jgi:hypothetical protein
MVCRLTESRLTVAHSSQDIFLGLQEPDLYVRKLPVIYCNVLGVLYSRWNSIALQKSIHYS